MLVIDQSIPVICGPHTCLKGLSRHLFDISGVRRRNRRAGHIKWRQLQRFHPDHAAVAGQPDVMDVRHTRRWRWTSGGWRQLISLSPLQVPVLSLICKNIVLTCICHSTHLNVSKYPKLCQLFCFSLIFFVFVYNKVKFI